MNYETFFQAVRDHKIEIAFDHRSETEAPGLSNEALFHLPLIAITILSMAGGKRKPKIDQLGQLVGECFERTFVGFKGSSQHLGWSANLRVRTVKALTFLEASAMVVVAIGDQRITTTEKGKEALQLARSGDGDLAYTLALIERNYRNFSVEKNLSLSLSP